MSSSVIAAPILDSKDLPWVTARVIDLYRKTRARIHLINVQPAYPRHITRFFSAQYLARIHHEDGLRFLAPAIRHLAEAGVPHWDHVLVGARAEQIVEFVRAHHCRKVILREETESTLLRWLGVVSVNHQIRDALGLLAREAL
jgi:hypothetical protein